MKQQLEVTQRFGGFWDVKINGRRFTIVLSRPGHWNLQEEMEPGMWELRGTFKSRRRAIEWLQSFYKKI